MSIDQHLLGVSYPGSSIFAVGEIAGDIGPTGPAPQACTSPGAELASRLDEVFAAEQALAAQRLALIAQIDALGLPARDGATSTAAWLRHRLHIDPGPAKQMVMLARSLDTSLPATAEALGEAKVNEDQAHAIHQSMTELPRDIGTDLRVEAEKALIGFAAQFCPAQLARLGGRILEHVAPDVAERHDRDHLERAEARAFRDRAFTLSPHGPGRVRVSGWLDTESAATVAAAIDSLCAPTHAHGPDSSSAVSEDLCEAVTPRQRRADALVQVCRMALGGSHLPGRGGERPQVVVTMPFQPWHDKTIQAVGQLDNGQKVSPQTLRRMACDADVIPVVLGTDGQPLDVGRRQRLITTGIRKALAIRDGGCAFPACDRPASWCDGHHIVPWLAGGVTSVDNGVLLCRRHHVIIHENQWQVRLGADQLPEFIPPSYVDKQRKPLRNQYWKQNMTQPARAPDHGATRARPGAPGPEQTA